MNERWLPIVGHEELYEVSDQGRVRSYARYGAASRLGRSTTSRLLTPSRYSRYGYVHVQLGRKSGSISVHDLVMRTFVGENNGLEIDHIDGNPSNNWLENLRYVTHAENMTLPRERKPQCKSGHDYAEHGYWERGKRCCGECRRIRDRRRWPKRKAAIIGQKGLS